MNIIQQKIQTFKLTDRIIDLFLLLVSARLAIVFERIFQNQSWHGMDSSYFNIYALLIVFMIWLVLIYLLESDLIFRYTKYYTILKNITLICFIGVTSLISLEYLLKANLFKRSTIVFFGIISFSLLLLKRFILKYFLSSIREEGFDPKNILIIGSHRRAERIVQQFSKHKEYGFRIKAILDPDPNRKGARVDFMKVSGDLLNIKSEIMNNEIDEVFFAIDLNLIPYIHSIFTYLDNIGVSYHMMINESVHTYADKYLGVEPVSTNYYGMPMLSFESVLANHFKLYIKNVLEKIFALLLLIFTFPILLFFGVLVKLTSKGPVIYKQLRVGLQGRRFYQYKIRSMVNNAEEVKEKLLSLNEQDGPVFKMKNDPRITTVGKFIRKYSIDELPQLINILIGSMSLIGPRPLPVDEVDQFDKDFLHRRHSMKPGVTGLWQVSGRNKIQNFNDWVKLDMKYIDNWSFTLDLKIVFKTISTILSGSGV
tara:strand:- start:553 stop:1998 length:1446 start_codon:yes stop_codon:yes gene_type:complete